MCGEFIMHGSIVAPNDFFLQNNCLQEQVEICLEICKDLHVERLNISGQPFHLSKILRGFLLIQLCFFEIVFFI